MWGWVAVWLLIVVVGTGWLVLLGREVVRKGARLVADLEVAAARAGDASSPAMSGVPVPRTDDVR